MAWLVQKPDPLPLFEDESEVFRREDQFLGSGGLIAGIDRQHAPSARAEPKTQDRGQN